MLQKGTEMQHTTQGRLLLYWSPGKEINHCLKWAEHSWEWLNCVCSGGKLSSALWSSSAGFLSSERLRTTSASEHHSSKSPWNGCKKLFGSRPSGNFLSFQIVGAVCQDPRSTAYLESKQLNVFGTVDYCCSGSFYMGLYEHNYHSAGVWRSLFLSQHSFAEFPACMYREDTNWQKSYEIDRETCRIFSPLKPKSPLPCITRLQPSAALLVQ